MVNRRQFLGAVLGGVTAGGAVFTGSAMALGADGTAAGSAAKPLVIPPQLTGTVVDGVKVFDLAVQDGTHRVLSSVSSATRGYNGSYLGPTLRVRRGDHVKINVTNHLAEDTTVHWHGAHVAPSKDGGPQNLIHPAPPGRPTSRSSRRRAPSGTTRTRCSPPRAR